MANKKIPFKYARPVEEWLQEKGNFQQACFYTGFYWYNVKKCTSVLRMFADCLDLKLKLIQIDF